MALFHIDIEKSLGSEFWSNRYLCDMTGFAQALVLAADITDTERLIHSTLVTFTKYRVSDPNSEAYQITALGVSGTRATTDLLPLFNTLRYDFPAETGRPSRKYYRGVLGEGDINGSAVTTLFGVFETAMLGLLKPDAESQGIVDPQEQLLTTMIKWPFVQMRQLRRGTRRRSTPIFQ